MFLQAKEQHMIQDLEQCGRDYLSRWQAKDLSGIASWLHQDIHFIGAMTETKGKADFLKSVEMTLPLVQDIKIRHAFHNQTSALFIYDFNCVVPLGRNRVAEMMTFANGKIIALELFFDARPFEKFFQGRV
jgi:hypothetical protein